MTKPPLDSPRGPAMDLDVAPEWRALLVSLEEPTIEPSAHFARNVVAAVHREERARALAPLPFPWVPLLAGLALVAGVATLGTALVTRGHEITFLEALSVALALVPLPMAPWLRRYFEA